MFEIKQVAEEWDMAWFCDKCDDMKSWKAKAYCKGNRKYCKKCAETIDKSTKV